MNGFDVEFLTLLSKAGRSCVIILASQPLIWTILLTLLERRKGCWLPYVWILFQSFLTQILIGTILQFYYSETEWYWPLAVIVKIGAFAISLFLLCYLFNDTVIKVMVANIIAEELGASIILITVMLINFLKRNNQILAFEDNLERIDFWIVPLAAVIFCIVYIPLRSLMKRFRTYEIRHKKIWAAAFTIFVSSAHLGFGTGGQAYKGFYVWCLAWIAIIFVIVAVYYMQYEKGIRMERDFLCAKRELLEVHYTAIQMQICRMQTVRAETQVQMAEIIRESEWMNYSRKVDEYMQNLSQEYKDLLAGNFCDDWMMDAFLYCETIALKNDGVILECALQGYDRGMIDEKDLIQMLFRLFKIGKYQEGQKPSKIILQMVTVRDRLFLVLTYANCSLSAIGKKRISKYIQKYEGNLNVENKQGQEEITIGLKRMFEKV